MVIFLALPNGRAKFERKDYMKKIISLLLVLVMTVSVLGCAAISSGAQSSFAITPAVKEALYAHAYTGDSAESEAWVK